jgi:hypothetical protein
MLNQLKTIDTNLRTRLAVARTLRRVKHHSEKSEPHPAEDQVHTSSLSSALPPESVYFIIELA